METTYQEFLQSKIKIVDGTGFMVDDADMWPGLYPHQRDCVRFALQNGKCLIAISFGLGKTLIQGQIAKIIVSRTDRPFLIVCPLGVKHQFQEEDGPKLGQRWVYVTSDEEARNAGSNYLITNYERVRDGNIHPEELDLCGVSLDEGSVIRSLGSKTFDVFTKAFASIPYRFVATATPDPNDHKELIYFAEFLGVMDHGQALTRWFKRDPQKAGHLTIHPIHEEAFWKWVASWALFLYTPSDLGYSDEGYALPPLNIHWHRINVDHTRAWKQWDNYGQHRLILNAAAGVGPASEEKRETIDDRIIEMQKILEGNPGRKWLIWHHMEDERRAIECVLPEAVTVFGSQKLEVRERYIIDFAHGKIDILASKPILAGSGCNFQYHCYSNIFLGVDYKFQDFLQAIHRTYRFQQNMPVDVHIIYAESEDDVVSTLQQKWTQYNEQTERMREIVRKFKLSHEAMKMDLKRSVGVTRQEAKGKYFTAVNNDCVAEVRQMESDSVGLIHTSIPFGNHYEYTAQVEDFGHNPNDNDFWRQMDYLIPDLLRVLKPGRVAAIHVKDRILYGHQTRSGFMEVSPFSDECVMAFKKHGWMYEGRRTIVTDVVRENNSTYRLGWSEMTRDASKMGGGLPEYLLTFRKPPTNNDNARADEPVVKTKEDYTRARWQIDAHSFWQSNGNVPLEIDQLYDYEAHVARMERLDRANNLPSSFFLEPPVSKNENVWDDVTFMRTLNSEQSHKNQENHICPLPFDIVERAIRLYSNPGDLVLDPFFGLGTVGYVALQLLREAYGIELNQQYFDAAVRYCQGAEEKRQMPTLFDVLSYTTTAA